MIQDSRMDWLHLSLNPPQPSHMCIMPITDHNLKIRCGTVTSIYSIGRKRRKIMYRSGSQQSIPITII